MCTHGRTFVARPSRPVDVSIPAPTVALGAQVLYTTGNGHQHLATVIGVSGVNVANPVQVTPDDNTPVVSKLVGEHDGLVLYVMSPSGKTYVRQAVPHRSQTRFFTEADFTDLYEDVYRLDGIGLPVLDDNDQPIVERRELVKTARERADEANMDQAGKIVSGVWDFVTTARTVVPGRAAEQVAVTV